MNHTLYLILERHPRFWGNRIKAVKKRKPPITQAQALVQLEISIPDNVFDPPRVAVVVTEQNIMRPVPEVKAI